MTEEAGTLLNTATTICVRKHTRCIHSRGAAAHGGVDNLWLPDDDSTRAGRQDQLPRATPQGACGTHPSGLGLSLGISIGSLNDVNT